MTLLDWSKRLLPHFEALATQRSAAQRRVFVLEHGLSADELGQLQQDIKAAAASRRPESKVSLPWIVYATEMGYRFSGDEFWQTFEAETPGFEFADRTWVRDQFIWFHRKFHGIRPTGPWAQHRSIICWPIANAVLPRDLQRQLARILFEMRYVLSAELFNSPEKLGQEIADRSWEASNRLQDLCQDPLLIGQIGAALLLEGQTAAASLVASGTLRRIAADLSREQQARDWLKTARGVAAERAQVRGLAPIRGGHSVSTPEKVAEEVRKVLPEPRLILRPGAMPSVWRVNLELPNMMPLVELVPQARAILTESRCEVAGASGRPLARGRLLQGLQHIPLGKWPQSGQPLLKFERPDPHLELIVRLCIAMPGPGPWLFRIASDGMAYSLKSNAVRAGQDYLLLGGGAGTQNLPSVTGITVECEGINGVMLEVPTKLEQAYIDGIKSIGVAVAPTIRVWPAGTAALAWDGEGRSEWLATEKPTFAIRAETAISSLIGRMNSNQFDLGSIPAGTTVFVGCPELHPGRHEVALFAKYGPFVQELPLGKLDLYIRAPRAWEPAAGGTQGPLLVDIEPLNPTLEQLRESRVQLTIRGPKGRELDVAARMFQAGNDTAIFSKRLGKVSLPILPESWNRYIQKNMLEVPEVADTYDAAKLCDIEFSGAELGKVTLRFERESSPVRWAIRKGSGRKRQISVISEAIEADPVEVEARTFENPDVEGLKARIEPNRWTEMPEKGGLFVAKVGKFAAAIVLAPEIHGLRDLKASVSLKSQGRSLQTVLATLASIDLWSSARLTGSFLSGTRQRDVIRALTLQLHEIICGETWARIEASIDERTPDAALKFFVAKPSELAIVKAILENFPALLELSPSERGEWLYEKLCKPYNLGRVHQVRKARDGTQKWVTVGENSPLDPKWVVEFALRLASDPARARAWGADSMQLALEKLLTTPAILRMARLMVMLVDRQSTASNQDIGHLYAGWNW